MVSPYFLGTHGLPVLFGFWTQRLRSSSPVELDLLATGPECLSWSCLKHTSRTGFCLVDTPLNAHFRSFSWDLTVIILINDAFVWCVPKFETPDALMFSEAPCFRPFSPNSWATSSSLDLHRIPTEWYKNGDEIV
jgi:hypothetical protein